MIWPLIMAGISVISDSQERNAQYKAQAKQNKAIREANTTNTQRTGFQVGLLNVQKGQQLKRLNQQRADLGQEELSQLSTAGNNAAASGTVGASVDAVQLDIQMQFERARSMIDEQNEEDAYNYNLGLHNLIQSGQDALVDPVKVQGKSDLAIVGSAAMSAISTYYSGKMNLGLGNKTGQTQAQTPGR